MLPAVDEPEVVFEPLVLPLADFEVRARRPEPEPEVLLPRLRRPLPAVMLPLVLPEVEPMVVLPLVVPVVEPVVLPIEPLVLPAVPMVVVPLVLPEVVPIVPVVLPLVVPMVVVPAVVPPVVVPTWAKAAVEIKPRPRAKAAVRSGRKICLFMVRKGEKEKLGREV